jgi:heat-inducible transcriptional repressor
VRNDLAALTEMGYLRQPHTSAGREPTEIGYRYFVQRLIGETELPIAEQNTISHQFYQTRGDIEHWMRLAASVLAQHGRGASLVTVPRQELARFKHLELIATQGRLVLLVLVLGGGEVRQQMLTLAEPVSQEALSATAQRINAMCAGQDADAALAQAVGAPTLEQEVIRLVAEMLRKSEAISVGDVFRDGVANVLAEPEFASSESARQALRVLEERTYLEQFLSKAVAPSVGGVQVVIGGENAWQELREFSMVLARYGVPGYATGALGVFGPQRMPYGRAISTVRFVAGLMSNLIYEVYFE